MCTCDKKHPDDALRQTVNKIALLVDIISQAPENRDIVLSGKGTAGLYWILQDTEQTLNDTLEYLKTKN